MRNYNGPTVLSATWVCHVEIKMWFKIPCNMIHAVPYVKYCQVLSHMFEISLSSDDSLQLSLVTKCSRIQFCFCLGLLEQTRQAEEQERHRSLGMC